MSEHNLGAARALNEMLASEIERHGRAGLRQRAGLGDASAGRGVPEGNRDDPSPNLCSGHWLSKLRRAGLQRRSDNLAVACAEGVGQSGRGERVVPGYRNDCRYDGRTTRT